MTYIAFTIFYQVKKKKNIFLISLFKGLYRWATDVSNKLIYSITFLNIYTPNVYTAYILQNEEMKNFVLK